MTYEVPGRTITFIAGADLRTRQYSAVTLNSAGQAVLPSAGGRVVGVLQNKPDLGIAASVMLSGITKMIASEAIAAGDLVSVTATGTAQVADTAGHHIVGRALEAAAAAGIYLPVSLDLGGVV